MDQLNGAQLVSFLFYIFESAISHITLRVSATNCACSYDMVLSDKEIAAIEQAGWQFGMQLTLDHVWDAVMIWTLIGHHNDSNLELQVPHTGDQKDRFTQVMQARNEHTIRFGQEEVLHYCNRCMQVYHQSDRTLRKCQVIVTDGLTLGHPCCGVFRCTQPLQNNCHRFCQVHFNQHDICAITICNRPVMAGRRACDLPAHQKMEQLHFQRGQAAFTLKDRLQRYRVAHPNSAVADDVTVDDLEENIEWFEIEGEHVEVYNVHNPGSVGELDDELCEASKSETGNHQIKAWFHRRRTHNELTLVHPCGVIYARATFYGAEAVSNVLVSLVSAQLLIVLTM